MISLELAVLDASALLVWLGIWPSREQLAGDLLEIQFAAMLVVPSTGLLARTAHRWDERSCSWGLASAAALAEQESLPLITVSGNVDGLTVIRLA